MAREHDIADTVHAGRRGIPFPVFRERTERALASLIAGQVRIRMSPTALVEFLRTGQFLTIFSGGSTRGAPDPALRAFVEKAVLGVSKDTIPAMRPIYGYLQGSRETHHELNNYGKVILGLHEAVRPRVNVIFGDAIGSTFDGQYARFAPDPLTSPTTLCRWPELDLISASSLAEVVDARFGYAEVHIYDGLLPGDIEELWYTQGVEPLSDELREIRSHGLDPVTLSGVPS